MNLVQRFNYISPHQYLATPILLKLLYSNLSRARAPIRKALRAATKLISNTRLRLRNNATWYSTCWNCAAKAGTVVSTNIRQTGTATMEIRPTQNIMYITLPKLEAICAGDSQSKLINTAPIPIPRPTRPMLISIESREVIATALGGANIAKLPDTRSTKESPVIGSSQTVNLCFSNW